MKVRGEKVKNEVEDSYGWWLVGEVKGWEEGRVNRQ